MSVTDTPTTDVSTDSDNCNEESPFNDEQLEWLNENFVPKEEHESKMRNVKIERDHAYARLERQQQNEKDQRENLARSLTKTIGNVRQWSEEQLDDIREKITKEQRVRSVGDSKLQRRVSQLEDETGVDPSDTKDDDRISLLLRNGPEAVAQNGHGMTTLTRACKLVRKADTWGELLDADANGGKRFVFNCPDVMTRLRDTGEQITQTTQVTRVFDKLVELAEDSPRTVKTRKGRKGQWQLVLHV